MALFDVALMARDPDLRIRIAASAATQTLRPDNPVRWAEDHVWEIVSSPGWADAWAYAVAVGNPSPGRSPDVITDGMILAAVQAT